MFCSDGKARKLRPDPVHRFPAQPGLPVCKLHYNSLKNLKRHWYKVVKSAMLTKVIIAISVTGSSPAHQEA